MPSHIALLRGVNVGGGGKLAMADLRQVLSALGHRDVATYIQSGNAVFTTMSTDSGSLADEIEAALSSSLGLRTKVIVLSRDELAAVIRANPYSAEPVAQRVHCVFLPAEPDEALSRYVEDAVAAAAGMGGADEATLLGRTLYLHTPGGFGTSELARSLLAKRSSAVAAGTARNWATVTKLLALCEG